MGRVISYLLVLHLCSSTFAFWDFGTTTPDPKRDDITPRQSFFRWQKVVRQWHSWGLPWWQKEDRLRRKRLFVIAGISIDRIPLSTAVILNRRTVISAANYLDNYMHRMRDLRIWTLGRGGDHILPFRYRIWRARRIFPRSLSEEHCIGTKCEFSTRHDVAVIHTLDPLYIYEAINDRWMYAFKAFLCSKTQPIKSLVYFVGSGYEYPLHIKENYKIFYTFALREHIVDCSIYLPKWWGKFICIKNTYDITSIQNGGGLFTTYYYSGDTSWMERDNLLVGIGCFEIRYNQDRIWVFTDLRYYVDHIHMFANLTAGEYYEYAYPEFSVSEAGVYHTLYSGDFGNRFIPSWEIRASHYWPLGRK